MVLDGPCRASENGHDHRNRNGKLDLIVAQPAAVSFRVFVALLLGSRIVRCGAVPAFVI